MRLRPVDDLLRVVDRLALVGHEHGHPALAGQLLHLAPAARVVEHVGQWPEPVGLDHLRVVARLLQRAVGVAARVAPGARAPEGPPTHVQLHSIPPFSGCLGSITAEPRMCPVRTWSRPSSASSSANALTSVRTGTGGASAMKG